NAGFVSASGSVVEDGTLELGYGVHTFNPDSRLRLGAALVLDRNGTLAGSGSISLGQAAALLLEGNATITNAHTLTGSGSFRRGPIGGQLTVAPAVTTAIPDLAADASHGRAVTTLGTTPAAFTVEGGATQDSSTPVSLGAAVTVENATGSTWTMTNGGFGGSVC